LNLGAGEHAIVPRSGLQKARRTTTAAPCCRRLNSIVKLQAAAVYFRSLKLANKATRPNGEKDRAAAQPETRLRIESRSMPDNNKDVTNAGGDQDYGQNVHWHVVSGMVADLVGDCERRRRQHEMGQDSHPAFREHEIGKNRQ
jgi:hypothetical protein